MINLTIIPSVLCVTIHNLHSETSFSFHTIPPCNEGPNKKGVKSRKRLSWEFLARPQILTLACALSHAGPK